MGPSWAFLGPSWGRLGAILGPSGRHLAKPSGPETLILLWFLQHLRSIDDLAPIFCSFSANSTYLSRSGAILAPSWAILGPSLAILGRLGAHLWAILGRLGAILGHLGAVLGPKLESQKTCLQKKRIFCSESSRAGLRKLESQKLFCCLMLSVYAFGFWTARFRIRGCGRSLRAAKLNPAALRQELQGAVINPAFTKLS